MLPVILLMAVDIALEIMSFGCLAFLKAEVDNGDGEFSITKIAYPCIKIVNVEVWLPIVGWTEVPVPIPYIYTDFSVDIDAPNLNFGLESGYDRETQVSLNGDPLSTVVDQLMVLFGSSDVEQQAPISSPNTLRPPLPTSPLDEGEDDTENYSLNIDITNIQNYETIRDTDPIEFKWTLYSPIALGEPQTTISVDGGASIDVLPDSIEPTDQGYQYHYKISVRTMNWDTTFDPAALRNGAHRVEVTYGSDEESKFDVVHFFVFNGVALLISVILFAIGCFIIYWLQNEIANRIGLIMEKMTGPTAGGLGALFGALAAGIGTISVLALIDAALWLSGSSILSMRLGSFPVGYLFALLLVFLGVFQMNRSFNAAPESKSDGYAKIFASLFIIKLAAFVVSEVLSAFLPPIFAYMADWIRIIIQLIVTAKMAEHFLTELYYCKKGYTGYVSQEMQLAMFRGSTGIGLFFGGITVALKTSNEDARTYY